MEPQERIRKVAPNAELPSWAQPNANPQAAQTDELREQYAEHFQVGSWSGMENLMCVYCDFATVDGVLEIVAHYESKHAPPAVAVYPSELVGPDGQPLASTLPATEGAEGEPA